MFKSLYPSVSYFRNFIFGVEDSLVSTVGLLSGVAIANVPKETIFLTGVVLICVEAFSMAAGSFLSESSAEEFAGGIKKNSRRSLISGIIMFFSYFISGFIPLCAYIIWPVETALKYSIIFSVVALFILGIVSSKISGKGAVRNLFKNSLRMAAVGSVAIGVGLLAGLALSF